MNFDNESLVLTESAITDGIKRVSRYEHRRKIIKSIGITSLTLVALVAFVYRSDVSNFITPKSTVAFKITCKSINHGKLSETKFTILSEVGSVKLEAEKLCGESNFNEINNSQDPQMTVSGHLAYKDAKDCHEKTEIWVNSKKIRTFCVDR